MAAPSPAKPVLTICAIISRYDEAFAWGSRRLSEHFGSIALTSMPFDHRETTYYEASMGPDLKKWFVAFTSAADSAKLADWKLATNAMEGEYASLGRHSEARPLNLDPGYLTEAKVVLATTKDRDHRLYLRDGIYAEVTLRFQSGGWKSQPWTYPDYQRADFHAFYALPGIFAVAGSRSAIAELGRRK
jgi:Domain of unknown function (DUF4416)